MCVYHFLISLVKIKKNILSQDEIGKEKNTDEDEEVRERKKKHESIDKKYTNYSMNLWHRSLRDTLFSAPVSREPGSEF